MARSRTVAALAAAALVPVAAPAPAAAAPRANPVVTWHLNAQHVIYEVARQPPYVAGRSFAAVSGAVYDAVNTAPPTSTASTSAEAWPPTSSATSSASGTPAEAAVTRGRTR